MTKGKGDLKKLRSKKLRILQWNADGLNNKIIELEEFMKKQKIDIAMIQETKLRKKEKTPYVKGFTSIRKDRLLIRKDDDRKGGGLLFLIKEEIPFREIDDWRGICTEGQKIIIHMANDRSIKITNVYRPPIRNTQEETRKQDPVRKWLKAGKGEIIGGDLNLHADSWGKVVRKDKEAQEVCDWCLENKFTILNDGSTTHVNRGNGNESSTDVTLASDELAVDCKWRTIEGLGSDHKPIIIEIRGNRDGREEKKGLAWQWRKADWKKYEKEVELNLENWNPNMKLAKKIRKLNEAILSAAKVSIPLKKVSMYNRPFWNEDLEKMDKERNKLRKEGREKLDEWKEANHKLETKIKEEKAKFWKEFVEELGKEKNSEKVWKTIKCLNSGKNCERKNETLVVDGIEKCSDKEKAESFIQQYAEVSKLKIKKEERSKRKELGIRLKTYDEGREFDVEFNMGELEIAINQMEEKKKGGCDGIEPAMIKHLTKKAKSYLLGIFNESWEKGEVPGEWKKAQIVPLLKEGKDPKKRESFRPVSLTSVVAKTMERIIVNRLNYWLEDKENINDWQAGFQRGKSTEDQIIRLAQSIQDGFEKKPTHKTLGIAIDCSKAYDKVWKNRLLERMVEEKAPRRMVIWYKNFLENRMARVKLGEETSKWRRLHQGLPQGAVSSPALFLLYVNDWEDFKVHGVDYSGFADDVALWVTGRDKEELRTLAAEALRKIEKWAETNKIELNPSKTEACLFTRNNSEKDWDPGLRIGNKAVTMKKEIKLLGVTIDQGLFFHKQTEMVVEKMKRRTKILRAVANKDWGWQKEVLVKIYKAMVESVVWYGAAGWMPWVSKTNMEKLESAQREALRVITGVTKSTRVDNIYLEAEVDPIGVEAKRRAIIAYEKSLCLQENNPRREICERNNGIRLKRNRGLREQARKTSAEVLGNVERRNMCVKRRRPWENLKERKNVTILERLEKEIDKKMSNKARKEAAKETIEKIGRKEMIIYTDGSVENGTENGGGAAIIYEDTGKVVKKKAAGKWCSSFEAEVVALRLAMATINERKPESAVIYTDSQALVTQLKGGKDTLNQELENLKEEVWKEGENCDLTIQWTPAHVGTEGNEEADKEANEARKLPQGGTKISFDTIKKRVNRNINWNPELTERAKRIYRNGIKRKAQDRKTSVILAQLRTGHCSRTKYYQHRIGMTEDNTCEDCGEAEGKDHVFECPRLERLRRSLNIEGVEALGDEEAAVWYLKKARPLWWDPGGVT